MKAAVASILAAAGAVHGQVNRSFEFGDLTAFAIHDGASDKTLVVQAGIGDEPASHGAFLAQLWAGDLTPGAAEALLGFPAGRLGDLYLDLGGEGDPVAGSYNIMSVDLASGTYQFDFMFETPDVGSTYFLDHAFVVNGAGQITVIADAPSGDVLEWTTQTVSHPGGELFFVSANGGDPFFDAELDIDDTRLIDVDNGSFETQDFDDWTVQDDGAGQAFVTSEFIEGFGATHGFYFARLPAGNLSQAEAAEVLGLEPGDLAQLYVDLGGTGNATAGDYLIVSQAIGGSSVSMDVAYKSNDAGSTQNLDHAFAVDSEGNITVLASTIGLGSEPEWERKTIAHSGGRFFIVSANGGGTGNNGTLYVDNVAEGPLGFDASGHWNGSQSYGNFGGIYKQTMGQLVEPAERSLLETIKFYIFEEDSSEPFQYQAFVQEWDGTKLVGDPLFASNIRWTDGADGGELVIIDTPGVILEKNRCYVVFLTTTTAPSTHFGHLGSTGDVIPGMVLFNGNDDFESLKQGGWLQSPTSDLAFEAELAPIDVHVAPEVNQFVEGPSGNAFPWGSGGDFRYQQLYAAEQFDGQAGEIDSFAYRVQAIGNAFGPVDIEAQIWMGYSDADPAELTTTFNNNFSFGKTLVHNGTVTLSSTGNGGFDVVVDIEDNFEYSPALGNLLIEVMMPEEGQPVVPQLDSAGYGLFTGGTPWTDRLIASSANAVTGLLNGDDGHVTRFNFLPTEVPYYPDCNGDGNLNILDFVCFQAAFQSGNLEKADCDGNGMLNILDFVCFQQAFVEACQ